eukprot:GGOE01000574.1.p1 GENE.GGOE01000574.1~~GGOE01000574.1.p1  ORF type:complete len:529 (+),score=83.75 GGOE01000574.1:27-1613(+)
MSYYPTPSYSYSSPLPASYSGSYGGAQRTYVSTPSEPFRYSTGVSGASQPYATAQVGGSTYSSGNIRQPTYRSTVPASQGLSSAYGIPAAQNIYSAAATTTSRPMTSVPSAGYTSVKTATSSAPLRTVVQQQAIPKAPVQSVYTTTSTTQAQYRPAAAATSASTTMATAQRQPIQVPLTKPVKPTAVPAKASKTDDDVVEITTPAAKALGDDVIDVDRDKVFDALFDAQEKAEESLVQQVQHQLMITGPPSDAQAEQMQKQAEQRFLRIPLEKVWAEFTCQHKGQAITEEEHCELVRCFITANKRWSTTKNEEGKQQMAMQMAAMGLPPGLAHMMTAMTDNLVGGLEQTLYEKMSANYQLIAKAVWAQLQKESTGHVSKKAFMEKFLDVFSEVVDKGLEKALKSGELDAALGPLAGGGGPVIMVAAIPVDEMMGLGSAGSRGPLMLGAPPEAHSFPRQPAYSQPSYGSGYPSSAYGGPTSVPQYTSLHNQGAFGYGGSVPYGSQAAHAPAYSSSYSTGYAPQAYSRPY